MRLLNADKMVGLLSVFVKCLGCSVMAKLKQKRGLISTMYSKNKLITFLKNTENTPIGKMLKYRLPTI